MLPSDDGDDSTWSITQLYGAVVEYLDARWGKAHQVWVAGEVQKLSDHRSGHGYLDLVDPMGRARDAPTLKAKCWRSTWGPMKASLRRAGLSIADGSVVRVRGYVDVYAPRGELGFIVTELDLEALRVATLGEHARRREALIAKLRGEGLLEANQLVAMPAVPLRVGLVASKGTEGYHDFMGVLDASGLAFKVTHARTTVQGATAAYDVATAIASLGRSACDVVCVVRGGGSQADLAAFDHEAVARAIAGCPVPVRTGIGHTGDVSVADLVANEAARTPTACAEGLVFAVREWYVGNVALPARRAREAVIAVLDEQVDAQDQARRHLAVVGRHRLARADDTLATVAAATARHATRALDAAGAGVARRARRVGPLCDARLTAGGGTLAARRSLLVAYDPARLLARGWSITTDADGQLVRSVADLEVGAPLATRLADGVARSTVTAVEPAPEEGS